jgi:plasmid maintenance system antidote protein VapI
MKLQKLKGKIIERGINVEALAERIGTTRTALYRKLNNFEKITIGEAKKIKAELNLSDEEAVEIFLS